ncbi:unnamed protein product [Closterium sp. NIES-53]
MWNSATLSPTTKGLETTLHKGLHQEKCYTAQSDRAGQTCEKPHSQHRCFSRLDDAWRAEFGDEAECPRWVELLRSGVDIFALEYNAIFAAMYALSVSAEGDCYLCVPPDLVIEAASLRANESALPGTAVAEALHTFTLDSGASRCFFCDSTTLTPLPAPVLVRVASSSGGPILARSSTVLPCLAVPSGSLSGLHLPSFSTNLVSVSGQVAPPCSCCLLSHQTLLWHHRLGHPSLPRLRGMHSRLLVSGLPRSLPPLPPSPAPPCLPCVEGRQRAAPHSSLFPPTIDPLQTLHMDVWGPARVSGQGRERYFLLVVDDYMRYTTVFPLRNKGEQNGIAERRISLVMEVARTSTIHAVAPHFLWPFAVRYTVHQLNLWPHVSLPETSPTLRWIRKVGDASVFRVWGSRAFVLDTSADKLSSRAIPCDVMFDESLPFCHLFPYCSTPLPTPSLFLAPAPPPVDPLPPQGPAPSGVSQVDPLPRNVPLEVAVDSGGVRGTTSGSALSWVLSLRGAEPGGPEPEVAEPSSYESECAGSGGAEPRDTVSSGGLAGALPRLSPRPEPLSSKQLREWFAQRTRLRSGAAGAGDFALRGTGAGGAGFTSLGGAGVPAGAGGTGGAGAAGPGGARTRGTGAAGAGSVGGAGAGGAGAGDTGAGGTGAGGAGAGEAGAGFPGAGGAGAGGTGADDPRSGGAGAGGAASCDTGAGGTVQRRPIFIMPPPSCLPPLVSVLYQVLIAPSGANIVDAMWIFRVKRPPPGSPPVFKARYVARGFSQRQVVDFFQTFSPNPNMTTLPVLLHVTAQCDYELHSLDFSTPFLQGSLHKEILLRRPPGFTGSFLLETKDGFPEGTQRSLRRPVYSLRQAPCELSTTLAALGFAPSTADPSLFLRTDTSLPPFYVLVYVDDLVFVTADTEALALVKSELQKRHTCTDLGPSALRLLVVLATVHSSAYRTSGIGLVLGGRGPVVLTGHAHSSWRSIRSSSVLNSSCEVEIYAGAMAAQELRWLTYLLTDLQRGQLRLAYVATWANTANIFTKALQSGDHQQVIVLVVARHDVAEAGQLELCRSVVEACHVCWRDNIL